MSTLKTHNLQSPDSGSANIALTPNAGMVVTGVTTLSNDLNVDAGVLFVDASANRVGINTTTPSTQLQIVGSTASAQSSGGTLGIRQKGDSVNDGITLTSSHANSARFYKDSNGSLHIFNTGGSSDDFVLTNAGNVAIGTDTAATNVKLTVQDSGTTLLRIANTDDGTAGLVLRNTGSSDWQISNTSATLKFEVAGNEKLRLTSDGNVGINTSNPTEQLEIYNGASNGDTTFRMRSLDGSTQIYLDARGTNDSNYIYLTDSSATYNSFIQRSHSSNASIAGLRYCYNGSANEAIRISESGGFDMGNAGYGDVGQVLKSNGNAPPTWSGGAQRVLEVVSSPCDGSTISSSNGDVTFQNVTGVQNLSTTFTDVTGSKITYTPPTGTTQVIYEFNFQMSRLDALAISHYRMYIAGNEVTYARSEISAEDCSVRTTIRWIFNIGGSTNNATGRQSTWTSGKEIKLQAEDYGGSYDVQLHETNWWNGASTDVFCMPTLSLTAIGV